MNTFQFVLYEENIERYAQLSGDFNPIHLDLKTAQDQGFSNKVAHGMLSMAKIWAVISSNYPPSQLLPKQFSLTFSAPVYVGQKVILTIDKSNNKYLIEGRCENNLVLKGQIVLR